MRVQLKLEATKNVLQEHFHKGYFTAMHGILANICGKDGKFCFGNIFPVLNQKIEEGKPYTIIISSSDSKIIEKIFFSLEIGSNMNIGELQFKLLEVNIFTRKLSKTSTIESMSPINLTINNNGKIKALKFEDPEYIKRLRQHLLNKYNFLSGNKSEIELFNNVDIGVHKKHPSSSFQINFFNKEKNDKFDVIGNKLVFKFKDISEEQLKIFQTLFDAGFGERTTFGAGFMIERFER